MPIHWVVYGALGAVLLLIFSLFVATELGKIGRRKVPPLPIYSQVPAFHLTNQHNRAFSLENLKGKIWLADIIFTRCPSSCERMSRQMAQLQNTLRDNPQFRLVSLTADPPFDTPPVLAQYAQRHGAAGERWTFLTGPKEEIYKLAVQGLKLVVVDKSDQPLRENEEMFLHSVTFVLVDSQAAIRGYYDSSEPEAMEKVIRDIQILSLHK